MRICDVEGRYRILGEIGRGRAAVVYRAHDARLGRHVAVKAFAGDSGEAHHEGLMMACASHRHLVQLFSLCLSRPPFSLVMELVEGPSLEAILAGERSGLGRIMSAVRDAALGAHALHLKGIVHRDLTPSNILLGRDGATKIVDFGRAGPGDGWIEDLRSLGSILFVGATGRPPPAGEEFPDLPPPMDGIRLNDLRSTAQLAEELSYLI